MQSGAEGSEGNPVQSTDIHTHAAFNQTARAILAQSVWGWLSWEMLHRDNRLIKKHLHTCYSPLQGATISKLCCVRGKQAAFASTKYWQQTCPSMQSEKQSWGWSETGERINNSRKVSCHSKYRAIYTVLKQILCYIAHIFLLVKGKKEKWPTWCDISHGSFC